MLPPIMKMIFLRIWVVVDPEFMNISRADTIINNDRRLKSE